MQGNSVPCRANLKNLRMSHGWCSEIQTVKSGKCMRGSPACRCTNISHRNRLEQCPQGRHTPCGVSPLGEICNCCPWSLIASITKEFAGNLSNHVFTFKICLFLKKKHMLWGLFEGLTEICHIHGNAHIKAKTN